MRRAAFVTGASCALLGTGSAGSAAAIPRVAIVVRFQPPMTPESAALLEASLAGELLKSGKFDVVERARVDVVLAEQRFSHSNVADPSTAAAIGKIIGATQMLAIECASECSTSRGAFVASSTCQITAAYTLIDVASAKLVSSGTAQGSGVRDASSAHADPSNPTLELLREAASDCAEDVSSQLTG